MKKYLSETETLIQGIFVMRYRWICALRDRWIRRSRKHRSIDRAVRSMDGHAL